MKVILEDDFRLDRLEPNKGQIKGLPKNPRFIKTDKFNKLKKSLVDDPEMLFIREIVAIPYKGKFVILMGNMRYRALKDLGIETAPVKIIPEDTPIEKQRRYVLKDNASFGENDEDELLNNDEWREILDDCGIDIPGVDTKPLEEDAQEDNFDMDDAVASNKKPKARLGDVFQLGDNRLVCGDATDPFVICSLLGEQRVDLLLTDPPYNVDYNSKNEALASAGKENHVQRDIKNDRMDNAAFLMFLSQVFGIIDGHLKPTGAFYVFHADNFRKEFQEAVESAGWQVKQCLIWNKNTLIIGRQDYQWKHEPCLYGWKEGKGRHFFTPRRDQATVYDQLKDLDIDALTKEELRQLVKKIIDADMPSTVIDEPKPQLNEYHPTMKPIKLVGRFIRNSTRPGELVLDPFGGSGSTLIAAEQLGRRCYMVELEPVYVDAIIKRWEELTGDKARLVGNIAPEVPGEEDGEPHPEPAKQPKRKSAPKKKNNSTKGKK